MFKNWKLLFENIYRNTWVKKYVEIRIMLFKNWKLLFKNTNQTPPKNQMVNQKKFECELQPRTKVEVANNQKKKRGLPCWLLKLWKQWMLLSRIDGWNSRARWVIYGPGLAQSPNQLVSAHKAPNSVTQYRIWDSSNKPF